MATVYSLDLYDKDNDFFVTVERVKADDTGINKFIIQCQADLLTKLCHKDMIVNRFLKDGKLITEPFDWATVVEVEVEEQDVEEYLTRY